MARNLFFLLTASLDRLCLPPDTINPVLSQGFPLSPKGRACLLIAPWVVYFGNLTIPRALHRIPIWQTNSVPSPSFTSAFFVSGAGPRINHSSSTPASTLP